MGVKMLRVHAVAEYFLALSNANQDDGITHMKLQKLCYYAQGHFLALYDQPLFMDAIEAWPYGCVIPVLYHDYKKYGANIIHTDISIDRCLYSDNEHILLDYIYRELGQYTAKKLSDINHLELPWRKNIDAKSVIPHEEMKQYFRKHPKITITEEDEEDEEDFKLAMSIRKSIKNGEKLYTLEEVNALLNL